MTLGKNRSPHQIFERSTWEPERGDAQILPKPTVVRPSRERMPFGPAREQPGQGVLAGELKPNGPGPFPDDIFTATDIVGIPWARRRGDEWTTADFRALVLAWLRVFFRDRTGQGLIGWDITEKATGARMGATRLPAHRQYLRIGVTKRIGEDQTGRAEVAVDFAPAARVSPYTEARLLLAAEALDVQLAAIN